MRRLFPPEEYANRRARLMADLSPQAVDLTVVSHQVDLFYLSGTCQASYLLLTPGGEALLLAKRGAARAIAESTLPVQEYTDSAQMAAAVCRDLCIPRRIGLAFAVTRHDQVLWLRKAFPQAELIDIGPVLRGLRRIKSPAEIELIRLAARQLDGACRTAASLLRIGQSELELAIRIEAYLRRKGHPGLVRVGRAEAAPSMGYVAAGASTVLQPEYDAICTGPGLSPAVPFGPGGREFRRGEPVFFDYLGCCAGYLALESRMLSLGPPPAEASWAYEAMRQILRRAESRLGPGQAVDRLYETARREARLLGYEDHFLSAGQNRLPFVGHGIGLELDEPPMLARGQREPFEPGMVVAIEPKAILPGLGVVGLGNTYLVTENGFELLTAALEEWRQVPAE